MLVRHVGGRICILGGFDELKYCRITLLQLILISIGFNLPDVFVPEGWIWNFERFIDENIPKDWCKI